MVSRRAATLLPFLAIAGCAKTPVKTPPSSASTDSAAVQSRHATADERKQLEHAMYDLRMALSEARHDTANPPRWSAAIDRVANELPEPDSSIKDASYAAAYQSTKNAIEYARWRRLEECNDQIADGLREIHEGGT